MEIFLQTFLRFSAIGSSGITAPALRLRIQPLPPDQLREESVLGDQLVICALFLNPSPVQHENAAAVPDSREPMRDHDPCTLELVQRFGYLLLRAVIQRGGRLIQDQDLRPAGHCAGDHESLLLSARDSALSLGYLRLHAHRHSADIVGNARQLRGFPGILQIHLRGGDRNVGENIPLEQRSVLRNCTDLPAKGVQVQICNVFSVVLDGALIGLFEAQKKAYEGTFAAAGGPYDRYILP